MSSRRMAVLLVAQLATGCAALVEREPVPDQIPPPLVTAQPAAAEPAKAATTRESAPTPGATKPSGAPPASPTAPMAEPVQPAPAQPKEAAKPPVAPREVIADESPQVRTSPSATVASPPPAPAATPTNKTAQSDKAPAGPAAAGTAVRPAVSSPAPAATTPVPASTPTAPTPAKSSPTNQGAAKPDTPSAAKAEAAPPLDLKTLAKELKETKGIGILTKLTIKNQVDDLLERFRAFYQGRQKTTLAELRQPYDLLMLKVISLLQDGDPPLARAVVASREAIWAILADPEKFAKL
jgi:hypothetical protein